MIKWCQLQLFLERETTLIFTSVYITISIGLLKLVDSIINMAIRKLKDF